MMDFAQTETHLPRACENPQRSRGPGSILRWLQRRVLGTPCAGGVILTLLSLAHAEEAPALDGTPSSPATEAPAPTSAAVNPVPVDPFIELRGSVWRTKAGIVFLKTPVGLLTLTSKT